GTLIRTLTGHTDGVRSVAWSPDGAQIASGSSDRTIKIWDVETGDLVKNVTTQHLGWVSSIAWSPEGARIASTGGIRGCPRTCTYDRNIKIWAAATGTLMRTLTGHTSLVNSTSWSPDGAQIASGANDRTVRVWQVDTGELLRTLTGHTSDVTSVAWSPDGGQLASGGNYGDAKIKIWQADNGELLRTLTGHRSGVVSV